MTPTKTQQRVLAVVAHPDDEVLGCGGALALHVARGDDVSIVILADGESSRASAGDASIANREEVARQAASILGAARIFFHGLPDNQLDTRSRLEIVRIIEARVAELSPDIVYTHHSGDVNIDHRIVHEAVVTACRPQGGYPVDTLLFFEIPSSTEWQPPGSALAFLPNWFVDISAALEIKRKALQAYDSEMRRWPHPRSYEGIESLARWRGATIGCDAAEAFMLGRQIQREL
jgi:LmbE family N-acetylglucosaminyl deacetylase